MQELLNLTFESYEAPFGSFPEKSGRVVFKIKIFYHEGLEGKHKGPEGDIFQV